MGCIDRKGVCKYIESMARVVWRWGGLGFVY